jgi:hypothetical protein
MNSALIGMTRHGLWRLRLSAPLLAGFLALSGLALSGCATDSAAPVPPAQESAQHEAPDAAHTPEPYDDMEDNMPEMENAN